MVAWLQVALVGMVLLAGFMAKANELPTAQEESTRLEKLRAATTVGEAVDQMTPDELATFLGLPTEAEFEQWLESHPEFLFHPAANILVNIQVSLSNQSMVVYSPDGAWSTPVSSGMHDHKPGSRGYRTKRGCYTPYYMTKMHYSKQYNNSPMPHSLFYYGGYAIHGTYEQKRLGRPASHGCVRLSLAAARKLYNLVSKYGRENTRICVDW